MLPPGPRLVRVGGSRAQVVWPAIDGPVGGRRDTPVVRQSPTTAWWCCSRTRAAHSGL